MRFTTLVLVAGMAPWAASARGGLGANGPKEAELDVVWWPSPNEGFVASPLPFSNSECALPQDAYLKMREDSNGTDPCKSLSFTGSRCDPHDGNTCKTYDLMSAFYAGDAPVVYCVDYDAATYNCIGPDFDGNWSQTMMLPSNSLDPEDPKDPSYIATIKWSCKGISGNYQIPCCPGYDCPAWPTAEPTTQPTTSSANAHHAVLATGALLTALLI
jgi:hypothetical protein